MSKIITISPSKDFSVFDSIRKKREYVKYYALGLMDMIADCKKSGATVHEEANLRIMLDVVYRRPSFNNVAVQNLFSRAKEYIRKNRR